jgi:hypothetical protein
MEYNIFKVSSAAQIFEKGYEHTRTLLREKNL